MRNIVVINQGDRFGRWTVVREVDRIKGHRHVLCKCDCGTEKIVNIGSLVNGSSTSCGCFQKECITKRNYKHGLAYRSDIEIRIYNIWSNMKRRCYNPKDRGYHNYGARGITVCDEWRNDFEAFYKWAYSNGYTKELTIDRIDNDKGYSPDNCRWTTMQVQSNNTRVNRHITYKGETHTIADWGRITGLGDDLIGQRIRKGFPLEKVFFNGNLRYYKQEVNE